MYDFIIIGAGPAGMTAAVYAARKKLDILVISKDVGGQPLLTSGIENYMGYQYVTGPELMRKFEEQVKQFPVALLIDEKASNLTTDDKGFIVSTTTDKKFKSRSVIIASGKRPRPLNVPGEKELVGRGVSYCATCDAPLFGEMDVAVIGGGNSALTAVIDLLKYAGRIYLIEVMPTLTADLTLIERAKKSDKVEFYPGHLVKEIRGTDRVENIVISSKDGGEDKTLSVSGVLVEIGLIPNSEFAKGLVKLNHLQEIAVDCECKTSVEGIFAAGDVTNVPEKQIIVAAGEGAKAALSTYNYLLQKKNEGIS
ncbi:MAG TPA: FAD-binding protein [Nitrospirae bacterium]|nr:FAD-binding protein [Nitrospirota bacterium]